jgi:lipopolysaccharide/colanic/teichoic acid biosynthesis glycosyltransferase
LAIKRGIDVIGSVCALLFLAPVFALIAAAIKLTSRGPVLFRQERLGQYGKPFTVLKFRSMESNCDTRIHQQYVSQFIAGQVDGKAAKGNSQGAPIFKI